LIIDSLATHFKSAYPRSLTAEQFFKPGWVRPEGPLMYSVLAVHVCCSSEFAAIIQDAK
jgi:hypothetical protein